MGTEAEHMSTVLALDQLGGVVRARVLTNTTRRMARRPLSSKIGAFFAVSTSEAALDVNGGAYGMGRSSDLWYGRNLESDCGEIQPSGSLRWNDRFGEKRTFQPGIQAGRF